VFMRACHMYSAPTTSLRAVRFSRCAATLTSTKCWSSCHAATGGHGRDLPRAGRADSLCQWLALSLKAIARAPAGLRTTVSTLACGKRAALAPGRFARRPRRRQDPRTLGRDCHVQSGVDREFEQTTLCSHQCGHPDSAGRRKEWKRSRCASPAPAHTKPRPARARLGAHQRAHHTDYSRR